MSRTTNRQSMNMTIDRNYAIMRFEGCDLAANTAKAKFAYQAVKDAGFEPDCVPGCYSTSLSTYNCVEFSMRIELDRTAALKGVWKAIKRSLRVKRAA
jgi:hypothetical protein